jgi:hypothetical protein
VVCFNREVLRPLYETCKNSHGVLKRRGAPGTLCRCKKLHRIRPLITETLWLREGLGPRILLSFKNISHTWCWYLCVFQPNHIRFHYTFTSEGTASLRMLFKAERVYIYLLTQDNKILYFSPHSLFVCFVTSHNKQRILFLKTRVDLTVCINHTKGFMSWRSDKYLLKFVARDSSGIV